MTCSAKNCGKLHNAAKQDYERQCSSVGSCQLCPTKVTVEVMFAHRLHQMTYVMLRLMWCSSGTGTASQIFLSHMQIIWLGSMVNTLWKLMCTAEQAGRICGRHIYKRKMHLWTATAGMDTIQHSMFPHLVFWWRHWTHIFLRCLIRSSSGDCPSDIIFILIKPFTDCLVPCGWEGLSSQKLPCWMLVCNSGNPFFWWVYQKCCCCVYTPEISCYRCNIWVMKHIPVLHFITCGRGFTRWKRQVHAGTLFNVVCAVAVQQNSWRLDSE